MLLVVFISRCVTDRDAYGKLSQHRRSGHGRYRHREELGKAVGIEVNEQNDLLHPQPINLKVQYV